MNKTTPTRDEAVPTGWRYSINYGPDGEENFANVYAADGQFVGNLRTHHAIAICNAFAVCEKLASAPAPASGRVDAVARRAKYLLSRLETDDGLGIGEIDTMLRMAASLSPAATPVSEAGDDLISAVNFMKSLKRIMEHERRFGSPMPNNAQRVLTQSEGDIEEWLIDHGYQHSDQREPLAKPASSPVVKMPTTEGYFWARWLKPAPGTADNGEGCDPERWEVVSVFENSLDIRSEEYLMVMVPGVEQSQPLENFEWGAEVTR